MKTVKNFWCEVLGMYRSRTFAAENSFCFHVELKNALPLYDEQSQGRVQTLHNIFHWGLEDSPKFHDAQKGSGAFVKSRIMQMCSRAKWENETEYFPGIHVYVAKLKRDAWLLGTGNKWTEMAW